MGWYFYICKIAKKIAYKIIITSQACIKKIHTPTSEQIQDTYHDTTVF